MVEPLGNTNSTISATLTGASAFLIAFCSSLPKSVKCQQNFFNPESLRLATIFQTSLHFTLLDASCQFLTFAKLPDMFRPCLASLSLNGSNNSAWGQFYLRISFMVIEILGKLFPNFIPRETFGLVQACRDLDLRRRVFKEIDLKRRILEGMRSR